LGFGGGGLEAVGGVVEGLGCGLADVGDVVSDELVFYVGFGVAEDVEEVEDGEGDAGLGRLGVFAGMDGGFH